MNALLRAKDLKGLLRARTSEYTPWVLLHPLAKPVYHDASGTHAVDVLSAGQFGDIPNQEGRSSEQAQVLWMSRVTAFLAYQFPIVTRTAAAALVWGRIDPVAVVGVVAESSDPGAQESADDYAEALSRIHQTGCLRQEVSALRYVIERPRHPFLVVRADASIVAGTEPGWDALNAYMRRRPSKKDPIYRLPSAMAAALMTGAIFDQGTIKMSVNVFPDASRETVQSLSTVTLTKKVSNAPSLEARLRTLTPSQRDVYKGMIAGLRNKEIASDLGVSIHTVIHHATAVFAKMGATDRLQLMAESAESSRKRVFVPPMMESATVSSPKRAEHPT